MVCILVDFIAFICVLVIFIITNSIFIIVYTIIIVRVRKYKITPVKEQSSDDLKSVSQTPLIFPNRRPKSGRTDPVSGQVLVNVFRDDSLVRKDLDRAALQAIYGTDSLELEAPQPQEVHIGSAMGKSKVSEKANIFENPQIAIPIRNIEKHDLEKGKVTQLSGRFKSGSHIPTGLQYKQKQVEEAPPEIPEEKPKAPKPKKVPRATKDPPSVFKGRHQRDDFLDTEFADLVDQTNQRLAEYTLAGIVETDVEIFANQHLTQQNIKHSQLEFNKTAFLTKSKDTPLRKMSDHKNMMLMAQSVYDDFEYEMVEKKATSLQSVSSQKTEVTALSQDNYRK